MKNKDTTCPSGVLGKSKYKQRYSNTASSQRSRILDYFKSCPRLSTMEAREMGILCPAARIMELREDHLIDTIWIKQADANGVLHRVGLYVYKGKRKEASNARKS